MEQLLEIRNLVKHFPVTKGFFNNIVGHIKAVDDISFFIGKGETFGLVGESGCGKTTVGKLILRLIRADSGQIVFNNTDILQLRKAEMLEFRSNIQMVFQDPYGSLNPRMTVESLIREPLQRHKTVLKANAKDRVAELLGMVGMNPDDMRKYPHEFSGGQRQRIAVARTLSLTPDLIVCDEPVSALDVSVQAQVINLLEDLQNKFGISYLFIAHGMPVVKHISDRVGVMYLGKLVEIADKTEIFTNCMHPYTKALISAVAIPDPELRRQRVILEGEPPNSINPPCGCKFHPRCHKAEMICMEIEPMLKQAEIGHMVACHFPNLRNDSKQNST